jgi:sugar/nucleoside kinase (ribokinase family)
MSYNFDFVAIGDITTDAFIKLTEETADIHEFDNGRKEKICFNFGDKIEYGELVEVPAVGNSPNAAVSAHRLGLNSAIKTNLGDDHHGQQCLDQLKKEGVSTDLTRVHEGKESNYHFVLWYEEERTILVKHHEYEYEMNDIGAPQWFYLSSLGENSIPFHHSIAEYVRDNDIKLAFQPGTFQIRLGYETLKDIYEQAALFFCNVQEARRVLETDDRDIKTLLQGVHELGPDIAVITDGPDGAYTYDGEEFWHMPMYPDPAPPVDRTGAGDSFSSTFTAMLAQGLAVPEALKRAPINSMSVVQYVGAQEGLLSRDEIEEHLEQAPDDYYPTQL